MKFSALSYISSLALGAMLTGLVSCSDEIVAPAVDGDQPRSGGINFLCADMLEVNYGSSRSDSRAVGSKDPREKEVHTLHVFFFNPDGDHELLTPNYDNLEHVAPYKFITEGGGFMSLPETEGTQSLFRDKNGNEIDKVLIVALANIDATDDATDAEDVANQFYTEYSREGKIQQASRSAGGDPYEIKSLSDLEAWTYYPRMRMDDQTEEGDVTGLPEAGMPMICTGQVVDLKDRSSLIVNMVSMMAKVNVIVKLNPDQSTSQLPTLEITSYGVRNMPVAVPFIAHTGLGSGRPDRAGDFETCKSLYDVTSEPMYHKGGTGNSGDSGEGCDPLDHEFLTVLSTPRIINKDSDPEKFKFTYYTYENINVPDYAATRINHPDSTMFVPDGAGFRVRYPYGVKDSADYQRWKSTLAYTHRASALVIKGTYTTHQNLRYKAQFTVYLGADADKDFMVKRNHQYDNTISIHGLEYIRNSSDDVYNFDGRVNVVDDNPFYLAILNERKVDAHASALPMDVWFMLREDGEGGLVENPDWDTKIKFTVRDHENVDWIRMEMVPRATMASTDFQPGTGIRDYFTDDLVSRELADNWEIEIDGESDGSRSRIYFYIDENVPANNNPTNYGDRMATIDIKYTRTDADGNVETRERTLDIEQRSLVKGTFTRGNQTYTTWIEYYEEYLEHSDPLDQHLAPGELYSGLPWGVSGTSYTDYYNQLDNYTDGFAATNSIVTNNGTASLSTVKLYNTEAPQSAFHYCYGKNKRSDSTGATSKGGSSTGWYLPGISELEAVLVNNYRDFEEFQNYFYWSACPAKTRRILTPIEDTTRARATKVINPEATTDEGKYAQSGALNDTNNYSDNNGTGGKAPRGTALRVRAFYKAQ